MRFTEKEFIPGKYRFNFLHYIDVYAPEVLSDLKTLTPKYKAVFGENSDWRTSKHLCWLFTNSDTNNASFILSELTGDTPRYRNDLDIDDLTDNEKKMLECFFDLKNSFGDFIERYYLKTDWLKRDLFDLLYYLLNKPEYYNRLCLATSYGGAVASGDDFEFKTYGWRLSDDSQEFERYTRAAFETHLQEYIQITAAKFRSLGYKRYKTRNFERVKWLVWWTVQKIDKKEIMRRIDAELIAKKGEETTKDSTIDSNTIDKAFAEFRSYQLPVR